MFCEDVVDGAALAGDTVGVVVALASVELYACACPDQGPNADLERCYALCEGCEPGHAKNVSGDGAVSPPTLTESSSVGSGNSMKSSAMR